MSGLLSLERLMNLEDIIMAKKQIFITQAET
jgi:hypothetical protein